MVKLYLKKKESLLEEMNDNKRCCSDCKTTQTPLWRSGPSGPKSLCNACGIRYRKKGIFSVSLSKGPKSNKREKIYGSSNSNGSTKNTAAAAATTTTTKTARTDKRTVGGGGGGGGGGGVLSESLKVRFVAVGKEVFLQGSPSASVKKRKYQRRRELGEVEQAAVCLVALSCDCFCFKGEKFEALKE